MLFFKENPDLNPCTYPRKNFAFLLVRAEEDIIEELYPKTATDQLEVCMQVRP